LKNSAKVGIGIGTGFAIIIGIIMIFTNVGDMVSNTISEVEIINPLQTYEINTKEDFVCSLKDTSKYSGLVEEIRSSPEVYQEKYSKEFGEMTEYIESGQFERDMASTKFGSMPHKYNEILISILMKELSINPVLEDWMLDMLDGNIPQSKINELQRKTAC